MKKLKFNAISKTDDYQGGRNLSQLLLNQSKQLFFHVFNILIIKNMMDIVMTSKYKINHLKLVLYPFVMAMMWQTHRYGHQMWQTALWTSDVTDKREIHYKFVVGAFLRDYFCHMIYLTQWYLKVILISKELSAKINNFLLFCLDMSVTPDVHNPLCLSHLMSITHHNISLQFDHRILLL